MLSGAILAGGLATRFNGRDKSTLIVEGQTLLDRQLRQLRHLTDDVLVVGARHEPSSEDGLRYVDDRAPGNGPLGGLDAAMALARHEVVIVLACDMPYVTAPLLGYLAERLRQFDETDAAAPCTEQGYHPLCAAYRRRCHGAILKRIAARKLALKGLLEQLVVRAVTRRELAAFGDPDRLLANVNTAAEYDTLLSHKQ